MSECRTVDSAAAAAAAAAVALAWADVAKRRTPTLLVVEDLDVVNVRDLRGVAKELSMAALSQQRTRRLMLQVIR